MDKRMDKQDLNAIREKYLLYSKSDNESAIIIRLTDEIDHLKAERDEAVEDMAVIADQTNSALKCSCCKWDPNDMGCELDGSQFDDDGECHFEWRGIVGRQK
jgi:hypothetical protein